jgi:DNA-binding transcriptional LysR family regulator
MWKDIELRELRAFLVLAEELHFGRTAERLRVTPSRVSQSLRGLESKLGGQLVYRTSRRVELTALGERFREDLGAANEQLAAVLERTYDETHALEGTLRLGLLTPAVEGPHLPAITETFQRRHPECRLELSIPTYGEQFDRLRRGEIDLLLSWLPHGQPDLVDGPILTREPRVLAVAQGHPLAHRDKISLEEIADYYVLPNEEVFPKELAEAWIPHTTPSGRIIRRFDVSFGKMARDNPSQLRQQMSWWIQTGRIVYPGVPAVKSILGPNVVYVPIADMPPMRAALVWLRRVNNPRLQVFVRVARRVMRDRRSVRVRSKDG